MYINFKEFQKYCLSVAGLSVAASAMALPRREFYTGIWLERLLAESIRVFLNGLNASIGEQGYAKEAGLELENVKTLLRHEDIATTSNVYGELGMAAKRRISAAAGRIRSVAGQRRERAAWDSTVIEPPFDLEGASDTMRKSMKKMARPERRF